MASMLPGPAPRRLVETRHRGWVDPARAPFDYALHTSVLEQAAHFWVITWDLAEPYTQKLVTHPSVNITITEEFARVAGVVPGGFDQTLTGSGRIVGLRFRPGGFHPFLRRPVAELTGRFVPLTEMYGEAGASLAGQVLHATDEEAMSLVEAFLTALAPEPDPLVEEVAALVERTAADPSLTRVDQLAAEAGRSVRSLQRLFHDYVGIGPKWVIKRYRLHEVAERLMRGAEPAALAAELGYTDQAHLTRDFTTAIGMPPAEYTRLLTGNH